MLQLAEPFHRFLQHPRRGELSVVSLLILAGCCGLLARFWLAANSIGCNDAFLWSQHASYITERGVRYAYEHDQPGVLQYNHPPLMGYFSVLGWKLTHGNMSAFSQWMKAPGLVMEVLGAFLVWNVWRKRTLLKAAVAFAAYGVSLSQIAVSGYHCNTDCACAGLTLVAFYLFQEKRSPLLAGLALAASLNVKLMPIVLIAPLFSQCRSRREAFRMLFGLSLGIIPFLPFLLTAPQAVYKNMLAYNSQQLEWGGYTFLKYAADHQLFRGHIGGITRHFVNCGRFYILFAIGVVSVLAFFRKRRFGYQTGAVAWALFLVLTPGYGVQYAVTVLPLLFVTDYRSASAYSFFVGLMLVFIYSANIELKLPLQGYVQYYPFPQIAVPFGILAWTVLVIYLGKTLRELVADVARLLQARSRYTQLERVNI